MKKRIGLALALVLLFTKITLASEADYKLVIRDHKFEPAELKVPSGRKFKVLVENQDASPEEFESYELNREKVVGGNAQIVVYVGPLKPGRYGYFGDFHPTVAQGTLIVK